MTTPRLSATLIREGAIVAGVCVRPIVRELVDTQTGETSLVPIPCQSTLASACPPCADNRRRLRMQQCREGWHLDTEPVRDDPTVPDNEEDQADEDEAAQEDEPTRRVRSTRRRDDVPDLPRLPVEDRTVGRTFTDAKTGKVWRPSTFVTLTMGSYGRVRSDGTPVDPDVYDYRRAALDAMHLPKLWDRLVQNLRRAVGYDVQYFAAIEPQTRLAPHIHAAIRGAIPRQLLRQVVAATYATVWWPPPRPHRLHTGAGPGLGQRRRRLRRPRQRQAAAHLGRSARRARRRASTAEPGARGPVRPAVRRPGHHRRHPPGRPPGRLPDQVPHQVDHRPARRRRRHVSSETGAHDRLHAAGAVAPV